MNTTADLAATFAENVAEDNSHGYSQLRRTGDPDFDCSSLVIAAYKAAGVPLTCTYSGNMRADMLQHGFVEVPLQSGLRRGDVLLQDELPHAQQHTAIYLGGGMIVQAAGDKDGQPGDSSGLEIYVRPYYNHPWSTVLRFDVEEDAGADPGTFPPMIRRGSFGGAVLSMQTLLVYKWGLGLPEYGCDGDFGEETEGALKMWQRGVDLEDDGICGPLSWRALIGGVGHE